MDTSTSPTTRDDARRRPNRGGAVLLLVCVAVLAGATIPRHVPNTTVPVEPAGCCTAEPGPMQETDHVTVAAVRSPTCCGAEAHTRDDATASESGRDGQPRHVPPDRVADKPGGIAARLRAAVGTPNLGDVYLLMASRDPIRRARLYDATPFTHDNGIHPDTYESNVVAAEIAAQIAAQIAGVDVDVDVIQLTSAPGGGRSGGITYAIGYLNSVSDGAFTGDLRVAATGHLEPEGHIGRIDHIDAKVSAAHLAEADVLFTPTAPESATRATFGDRFVTTAKSGRITLPKRNDPARIELFHHSGATRPDGIDIVHAHHLIDIAAYLCGARSPYACHVVDVLDGLTRDRSLDLQHEERTELERLRSSTSK